MNFIGANVKPCSRYIEIPPQEIPNPSPNSIHILIPIPFLADQPESVVAKRGEEDIPLSVPFTIVLDDISL